MPKYVRLRTLSLALFFRWLVGMGTYRPETEILDKGYGAGASLFCEFFFLNIDQWKERVNYVAPSHWSIFTENFAKKLILLLPRHLHKKSPSQGVTYIAPPPTNTCLAAKALSIFYLLNSADVLKSHVLIRIYRWEGGGGGPGGTQFLCENGPSLAPKGRENFNGFTSLIFARPALYTFVQNWGLI